MNLVEHMETEFGLVQRGWSQHDDGSKWPFQVMEMEGGRFANTLTFSTIGLSNYELSSAVSEKKIRQELFIAVRSSYGSRNIPALLHSIGMLALQRDLAFLRGEIIDQFAGIALPETSFEAFYVAPPVYYPDSFSEFKVDKTRTAILCWLIPITAKERLYVKLNGWEAFEDKIAECNPDFFDPKRKEVV